MLSPIPMSILLRSLSLGLSPVEWSMASPTGIVPFGVLPSALVPSARTAARVDPATTLRQE